MKGSCLLSKGRGCCNHQAMRRISGPFGKAAWCPDRQHFMNAGTNIFSVLTLHNLEVKLGSDRHGAAPLLSCSFVWDGTAAPRKKVAACPSQGPGTLNFADSTQLRKALGHYLEQAVLWFGFERYTMVYLGHLFPRTSGTVPGRLWISWKCELTSRRSLTGTAWPSFHPAVVFQDTNSCFHTSLLPFKDSSIRTPIATDSNHSETMGHAKLSSQTCVAVTCFSHRDTKVNYTVSESSPLFLCPCQSLSGPRGVVVDQPPGIPIRCNIHHRGTKWWHHKKKKAPMILTMRYLLSSASPYGIFLFGYFPELLMGSTL